MDNSVLFCILNYGHDGNALNWYNRYKDKWNTYLIDTKIKDNNIDSILNNINDGHILLLLNNVYFGGIYLHIRDNLLYNECKHIITITSDVLMDDISANKLYNIIENEVKEDDTIGTYFISARKGSCCCGKVIEDESNEYLYNNKTDNIRILNKCGEDYFMYSKREIWEYPMSFCTFNNDYLGWGMCQNICLYSQYLHKTNVIDDRIELYHPQQVVTYDRNNSLYNAYFLTNKFFNYLDGTMYCLEASGEKRLFPKKEEDKDKYIICACAKNEDLYIREWVEHHLNIGFDKVIIGDNNDDSSILPSILNDYIEEGKVDVFDFSGLSNFQSNFFNMLAKEGNYKWCAYFDCDEFLEINRQYKDVKEFLDDCEGECVCLNWLVYGSNGEIYHKEGSVQDRFKLPTLPLTDLKENMFIKTILKGTVTDVFFDGPHYPLFPQYKTRYNIGGYYLTDNISQVHYPFRYKKAYIKHYYTKSFEEYLNKTNRGWPDNNDVRRLQKLEHFMILDKINKPNLDMYVDGIFSSGPIDIVKDVINNYDVVFYKSDRKNIYASIYYITSIMKECKNRTFILNENDFEDSVYNLLLELSLVTGNKLVCCKEDERKIYEIYQREHKILNDNYYIVNMA